MELLEVKTVTFEMFFFIFIQFVGGDFVQVYKYVKKRVLVQKVIYCHSKSTWEFLFSDVKYLPVFFRCCHWP